MTTDNRRRRPDRRRCAICRRWFFLERKDQVTCTRESCRKARKLWWARTHKGTRRICLKCGQPFYSEGFRICPKCHERNERHEAFAQAWG